MQIIQIKCPGCGHEWRETRRRKTYLCRSCGEVIQGIRTEVEREAVQMSRAMIRRKLNCEARAYAYHVARSIRHGGDKQKERARKARHAYGNER